MVIDVRTNRPRVVVLDVGHGNAAVVHEGATTILIDVAHRSHVLEYLRQLSIRTIELVVISHSDADHLGGLVALLGAGITVKAVKVNADADKSSEAWRDLVFLLDDEHHKGNIDFEIGLSSRQLNVAGFVRCRAEVSAPTPGLAALGVGAKDRKGKRISSNSISACIRILYDGKPVVLLTGDMDEVALDNALAGKVDLRAPVLVFPHHGGLPGGNDASTFTSKLMAAVSPKTVLFSNGRTSHKNPRPEIVSYITTLGAYVACTQLSQACTKSVQTMPVDHLANIYSSGASKRFCCAGSVTICLDARASDFDTIEAHRRFVVSTVATPLCRAGSGRAQAGL